MDRNSDTTTLSPTPFSPFSSTHSFGSEGGTSDEPADLGQLAAVFEVLRTEYQPRTQPPAIPRAGTPTSSLLVSPSDGEEAPLIVWSQDNVAEFIPDSAVDSCSYSEDEIDIDEENGDGIDQPSLGYLDGVLGFLATERAKFAAQREAGVRGGASSQSQASTSENAWRHVIEPRRKRRRKRGKQNGTSISASGSGNADGDADAEGAVTPVGDMLDNSSSGEYWSHGKSMPATPPHGTSLRLRKINGKGKEPMTVTIPGTSSTIPVHPKLSHSRSTPSLRVTIPSPPDARVLRLRTLATKLRMLFVEDARTLSSVLLNDVPEEDGFIDPRVCSLFPPLPLTLIAGSSNILIGFLNHLRRFPRGRPITRRVLATSSPLYQPMEGAERLGYEVRVYARVPDLGDGLDRAVREATKVKRTTSGSTNADSDPGPPVAVPKSTVQGHDQGHSRSASLTMHPNASSSSSSIAGMSAARVRYREQGVDELLQLKLHQALADADTPPPTGATIVLATGDGNAGQFNADGFLGAVRTALRKGWRVELYAWEYGLSRAWAKEFGGASSDGKGPAVEGPYGDRFKIIGLEKFAQDLLEI
ncbi:hypothetical protein DFH11DRAFT_1812575 [Phellopilus nigrolimitatus]|nr:hypothetical protein DFH11DRAFT_1812575 [Phellopilus nigrolimitatus]